MADDKTKAPETPATKPAAPAATKPADPKPATKPAAPAPKKMRTVFVEAVRVGIWDHNRMRVGKRFSITIGEDEKLPSWVKEVTEAEAAAPDPAAEKPASDATVL